MSVVKWLEDNAPGYRGRSTEERNAIMEFSLLWSLFKAKALTHGNAASILEALKQWANKQLLTEHTFERELAYFQNR
jgi:hypothetical protein